ncbi:MAG: hypothetical protein ACOCVU_02820 [Desulfohalobiaceae bacterium]
MSILHVKGHCPHCRDENLLFRRPPNHLLHFLLSLLTLGLWVPVWIYVSWQARRWTCSMCSSLAGRGEVGLERIENIDLTPEDRQRIETNTTFVRKPLTGFLLFAALIAFILYLALKG